MIYTDAETSNAGIQVTGPAPIGGGGEAQWTITAATALGCEPPQPATFYTGPLASSPLAARVKAAGINATLHSAFGVIGGTGSRCGDSNWDGSALFGLSTVGNQLLITSFTPSSGTDSKTPLETITFNFQE